jgi:SAM-dependent methyltransferase
MLIKRVEEWTKGASYDQYVGRWSRLVAVEFVTWLGVAQSASWLDLGCGTGSVSETILAQLEPARVIGIDAAKPYVEEARRRLADRRVSFMVGDVQRLPARSETFDCVVSGLLLNFVPNLEMALAQMTRVTRPGGVVSAYVWDYAGKMQLMRYFWNEAAVLDHAATDLDEGRRFPICQPQALEAVFRDAGLESVNSSAIDVPTRFRNFDDYWSPFLGGQGPAPGYAMSLDEQHLARLRERVRAALPVNADGSIELVARAWAVRGKRA